MSWALLDDNFPLHPKVTEAVRIHPLARDLFVCGLCYCRKYLTGGLIPSHELKNLGFAGNPRRATDALLAVGLWDRASDGFRIHDYALQYDDEADKVKKDDKAVKRREAGRKGGLTRAANAQAESKQTPKQTVKQTSSNWQAHRSGVERFGLVSSGSSGKEETSMDVEWLLFFNAYPSEGRIDNRLTQGLFFDARVSGLTLAVMVEALDNHKASARWAEGKIPNLTKWLEEKRWLQRLPPLKAAVGGRTGAAPAGKYDGIEESD